MSNLQNGADKAQMIELLNSIKMPIMGAGGGFAPIGTINFFDASIAPQGWLACDGSTYNIADYPDLATYYASVHGSSNFYGGNGTTTFAVPDLRGEFLRGTGTNSHTNQGSGANVGVHQDGTNHLVHQIGGDGLYYNSTGQPPAYTATDYDTRDNITTSYKRIAYATQSTSNEQYGTYTSRPTNTSFLICVKATVSGDPNAHVYSTEEQVVGQWIDGSDMYEKTYTGTTQTTSTDKTVDNSFSNKILRSYNGWIKTSTSQVPVCFSYSESNHSFPLVIDNALKLQVTSQYYNSNYYLTVQYTKTSGA